MTPSRRTILGTAGAAALSRILLPWTPRPSDLLLADETPAGEPLALAYPGPHPNFIVYDGMTVTLDKGDWGTITVKGGTLRIGNVRYVHALNVCGGGTVVSMRNARPMFGGTISCEKGATVRGE